MNDFSPRGKTVFVRLNRLDYVPTGLYAAQLLREHRHPVLAIEYGFFDKNIQREGGEIPRLRFGHPFLRRIPRILRTPLLHSLAFIRLFALFALWGRPRFLIAEGLHEQTLVWLLSRSLNIPYAVHVHEVFESHEAKGWNRIFFGAEGMALRGASFTIFPQEERARIYRERYDLKEAQHLAFNCPRRRNPPVATDWRKRLGLDPSTRLLGYWGGQGRTNALEQGIRAVARLPKVYFLLWGWSSPSDRQVFMDLAKGLGAGHRILFLGELPEDKWSALAGLDAGYCIYEPKELRLKHLATASNKFMEALAAGVPVVTSSEPDFKTLVDFYDVGVCAEGFEIESITRAIRTVFSDDGRRQEMSANALRVHRELFHYEYQFRPILRALESRLGHASQAHSDRPLAGAA